LPGILTERIEVVSFRVQATKKWVDKADFVNRVMRMPLARVLTALGSGDALIVTAPGTSVNVLATVSDRGAGFRSLSDPWTDTTTPHGRLMLTVLGGLAEFERSLILTRTSEGRTRAMAPGIEFGRKPKLTQHQIGEAIRRRNAGEALAEIGRSYNVSHSTISRL
jgi:DNA invertase Pin-like site-specific DNA recombinase